MNSWQGIGKAFVVGVIAIGMATALFAPDRKTAEVLKAGFSGAQGLLSTAEGH